MDILEPDFALMCTQLHTSETTFTLIISNTYWKKKYFLKMTGTFKQAIFSAHNYQQDWTILKKVSSGVTWSQMMNNFHFYNKLCACIPHLSLKKKHEKYSQIKYFNKIMWYSVKIRMLYYSIFFNRLGGTTFKHYSQY